MADVKMVTVPHVYPCDPEIVRKSRWHTVWIGEAGQPGKLHSLTFIGGEARDVPLATFERFRDAGHATDQRPTITPGREWR